MQIPQIRDLTFFRTIEGRALLLSLSVGVIITILKVLAYLFSHSVAALTDMMESLVHNLAVAFALYCFWISARPPDDTHLYGHGKAQYFSAAVEGMLVLGAGLLISAEVVHRLFVPYELNDVFSAAGLMLAAGLVNGALGFYLIVVGKKRRSLIVKANGYHILSDFVTTAAALAGMMGAYWFGTVMIDLAVGALGAVYIIATGLGLIRSSVAGLMDTVDKDVDRVVRATLDKVTAKNKWRYHALRHRSEGNRHFIELHLELDPGITLREAHDNAFHLETELRKAFEDPLVITTHLEPFDWHEK